MKLPKWIDNHPDPHARRYWSARILGTPEWLTPEQKKYMRDLERRAHRSGLVVDHIVPLLGTTVCGLHVPWNLEAITVEANRAKSNHTWPDMWGESLPLGLHHEPYQMILQIG